MKILVLNSGSSSIKYQLFNMPSEEVICSGLVERIGLTNPEVHYKSKNHKIDRVCMITNHKEGLEKVVKFLLDEINKNKTITMTKLKHKLKDKFKIELSRFHINRIITDNNITLKITRIRHEPEKRFGESQTLFEPQVPFRHVKMLF